MLLGWVFCRFNEKDKTDTPDDTKRACHEHYLDGFRDDGTYTITASDGNKLKVYCDMASEGCIRKAHLFRTKTTIYIH